MQKSAIGPAASPTQKTVPVDSSNHMAFGPAFGELVNGARIRRDEWPDDGTYLIMHNEIVMIYRPDNKQLRTLIVQAGDIVNADWVVVKEK